LVQVKENLVGKRFGLLTVVKQADDYILPTTKEKIPMWECACDCGNSESVIIAGNHLKSGHTKSCGCLTKKGFNDYEILEDEHGKYAKIKHVGRTEDVYFYVDEDDLPLIKDYHWSVSEGRVVSRTKGHLVTLYQLIMGGKYIDHCDGNRLNNRRYNLRFYDNFSLNSANSDKQPNPTGFKGVRKYKNGRYGAFISNKNKQVHLGTFDTPEEAAKEYDKKAYELWGEFAKLNFPLKQQ